MIIQKHIRTWQEGFEAQTEFLAAEHWWWVEQAEPRIVDGGVIAWWDGLGEDGDDDLDDVGDDDDEDVDGFLKNCQTFHFHFCSLFSNVTL